MLYDPVAFHLNTLLSHLQSHPPITHYPLAYRPYTVTLLSRILSYSDNRAGLSYTQLLSFTPPTTLPGQPAKLTRQSLGPPTASSGAAKGFGNLGIASPTTSQPRHASSGVMPGNNRESLGARPSLGSGNRGVQGGRPSSEFLPGARDARSRTPESEL